VSVGLDQVFHALGDPSRLRMVERLSRGPASVMELSAPLAITLPSVLKHLKVLERGRLVRSTKVGRVRTYRIEPRALSAVERWVSRRRTTYARQFDALERLLLDEADEPRREPK
jgi:DNA-binding transcriptional ArsR family regulator